MLLPAQLVMLLPCEAAVTASPKSAANGNAIASEGGEVNGDISNVVHC